MDKDKLKVLLTILEKTDPSEFDMNNVASSSLDGSSIKYKYCVIGLLYREYHPDTEFFYGQAVPFLHKFFQIENVDRYRYAWDNKSYFIFGGHWASETELNTIEHAIHRVKLLLEGYEPDDISDEVKKECARLKIY